MKYRTSYAVRAAEMNPDYTLKAHYVGMYFQECFAEYAASRNVAAFDVEKRGLTWLTSDVRMEFVGQMPRWRELVDVDVWLHKTTAARMYVNFRMYHGSSEIARGATIQLIADINTRRPVRAEQIAEAFDLAPDVVFDDPFGKITQFDNGCCASEGMSQTIQTVRFDDLDFNHHLNNVRYIPRGLEAIPIDYRLSHRLVSCRPVRISHHLAGRLVRPPRLPHPIAPRNTCNTGLPVHVLPYGKRDTAVLSDACIAVPSWPKRYR